MNDYCFTPNSGIVVVVSLLNQSINLSYVPHMLYRVSAAAVISFSRAQPRCMPHVHQQLQLSP
jgi:hypothetical protein